MNTIKISDRSVYRCNLYDSIEEFDDYSDLFDLLATCDSENSVVLYINSPGGRIDVGVSLINSIKSSLAPVTAVVEGPSYSMASIIALACRRLIMLDNTFLMFHNYSNMSYGKGAELMNNIKHSDNHFNNLMRSTCHPFLTSAELAKIMRDQDIYIYNNDESLHKRKERHFK